MTVARPIATAMTQDSPIPSVSPPLSPPETICQTPNSAINIARLRTQPGGSRIQTQAMIAAMNGAVLWITRISATVACFSATTKDSEAEAKQQATTMPGTPSALNSVQLL